MVRGLIGGIVGAVLGTAHWSSEDRAGFRLLADVEAAPVKPASCALQDYKKAHSNIMSAGFHTVGGSGATCETIKADVQFFDSIPVINSCAASAGVYVCPYSSYRKDPSEISGATKSAHMVGHAIDFKLVYRDRAGKQKWCSGKYNDRERCLGKTPRPEPVQAFIDCVQKKGLRWGGKFPVYDPVHIDDGLEGKNRPKEWKERRDAVTKSVKKCDDRCLTCDKKGLCQQKTGAVMADCDGNGTCDSLTTTQNCGACGVVCGQDEICQDKKCQKKPEICPEAGGVCTTPSSWPPCGPSGLCNCGVTDQGHACLLDRLCRGAPRCTKSSDCGTGLLCLTDNCCNDGFSYCLQSCDVPGVAETDPVDAADGPTMFGSTPRRRRPRRDRPRDPDDSDDADEAE